jgi:uncharacterized protein (DUF924 family)
MTMQKITAEDVLEFWFGLPKQAHFTKDAAVDAEIKSRFGDALEAAKAGGLDGWLETPDGALAMVILLDQFSRNIHRGSAETFAGDAKALAIADELLRSGSYKQLPADRMSWLVMPFMHSEQLADQERCVELCKEHGLDSTVSYAIGHADIIRKFGRFPHRNGILNRPMRPEEQAFLDEGGFTG